MPPDPLSCASIRKTTQSGMKVREGIGPKRSHKHKDTPKWSLQTIFLEAPHNFDLGLPDKNLPNIMLMVAYCIGVVAYS